MADINQTAEWVTARLTELGNATNEGLNTLVTSENVGNYTAGNVSGTVAIENGGTASTNATDARLRLGITPQNIGAVPASGGTFTGSVAFDDGIGVNGDVIISDDLIVGSKNVMSKISALESAESATSANLAVEVTRATDAETALNGLITAETTRATNAENTLTQNLATLQTLFDALGLSVIDGMLNITYEEANA